MSTTNGQKLAAADVIAQAKTKTARAKLLLDCDLLDRHALLVEQLDAADGDAKVALADEILAAEEEMAAAEVEFVQRGMGRAKWRKMIADHPPTDEQRAAGAEYNVDTFPFEALAASLVDPVMTAEEVRALEENLDETQFSRLWAACLRANLGSGATRPESPAARAIVANGRRK